LKKINISSWPAMRFLVVMGIVQRQCLDNSLYPMVQQNTRTDAARACRWDVAYHEDGVVMLLNLDRASAVPLYRQAAEQIADLIRRGVLAEGAQLPTVRALAESAGLTRLTVQTVYQELQARGLIESFVGRGTFVAPRPAALSPPMPLPTPAPQPPVSWEAHGLLADLLRLNDVPDGISFAQANPDPATFPVREFGRALRTALEDPTAMGYSPAQGEASLREQCSRWLLDRGVAQPPEQILITNGAQHGIDLALRTFTEPGDVVIVEEPTYPGVLEAAALHGQRVVSIPLDDDGIDLARLEAACAAYHPRLLYIVPTYQNPTGISYVPARRAAILALAAAHGMVILEDDVYGCLALDGTAPPALQAEDRSGNVVYLTSFSKVCMPGLRLGLLAASPPYLHALIRMKQQSDLSSSPLLQRAWALFMQRGGLDAHLHTTRVLLRAQRDAMLSALARHLPQCHWTAPAGGLSVWLTLPPGIAEAAIVAEATQAGIGVARGQVFYPQPQTLARLRLSFSATAAERIATGIATLGRLVAAHMRQRDAQQARARREVAPLV
jgi:2-aminoadipate transaminase